MLITYADYSIYPSSQEPDEISKQLGIQPTRLWRKGEEFIRKCYNPDTGHKFEKTVTRSHNVWEISTIDTLDSICTEHHLDLLLSVLEPADMIIEKMVQNKDEYRIVASLWTELSVDCSSSAVISPSDMMRLCRLCQEIRVITIGLEENDDE